MTNELYSTLKSDLTRICSELRKPEMAESENWVYASSLIMDAARKLGEFRVAIPNMAESIHGDSEMHEILAYIMQETPRYIDGDRADERTRGRMRFELGH